MDLTWTTWVCCRFYGWSMPRLGLDIGANLKGGPGVPRWFSVKLGLLFLHIDLRIDGKEQPEFDEVEE